MRTVLLVALTVIVAHLASSSPVAPSNEDVLAQLQSMQEQMNAMRAQLAPKQEQTDSDLAPPQQKRMVAWQPMKRSGYDFETRKCQNNNKDQNNNKNNHRKLILFLVFLDPQQQKRMVAWQPMKRSGAAAGEVDRETLFRAIEARLMEVLAAGERLGISPEEILEHIRERNTRI